MHTDTAIMCSSAFQARVMRVEFGEFGAVMVPGEVGKSLGKVVSLGGYVTLKQQPCQQVVFPHSCFCCCSAFQSNFFFF